jgi:hypothetical protein
MWLWGGFRGDIIGVVSTQNRSKLPQQSFIDQAIRLNQQNQAKV